MGTKKVITEHSTIGVVMTTDGSIAELGRDEYIDAENRVVNELKSLGKPFVVLLNTTKPFSPETDELKRELCEKHGVPVLAVNCAQLKEEDITGIMESILHEFPVREIRIKLPKWIETLPLNHWLKASVVKAAKAAAQNVCKLRGIKENIRALEESEFIKKAYIDQILPGEGAATVETNVADDLFYRVLSETTGMDISGEYQLISTIKILAECKREYDKIKYALEEVRQQGYGIVTPATDELTLEEPKMVRHGSKYGVKLKASAPSIHMIRADIETDVLVYKMKESYGKGKGMRSYEVKYLFVA
jgi:stage IV sporulation protein A